MGPAHASDNLATTTLGNNPSVGLTGMPSGGVSSPHAGGDGGGGGDTGLAAPSRDLTAGQLQLPYAAQVCVRACWSWHLLGHLGGAGAQLPGVSDVSQHEGKRAKALARVQGRVCHQCSRV